MIFTDSEGSPYPPQVQRFVGGRENSTNVDALQPMLVLARNNADVDDFEQLEQQQQPRRLQLPPPPAMQPVPNAANENANIVQIPRSMMNVASRQQQLIYADNLVSQDSNGSSGTGQEDSGPEHRLDTHADDQPGPSSGSRDSRIAQQGGASLRSNIQNRSASGNSNDTPARHSVPYKLCILKDDICVREVEEGLKDIEMRSKLELSQYNTESGNIDFERTEHDYARPKSKIKKNSNAARSIGERSTSTNTNVFNRARREERERLERERDENESSLPNRTDNSQPRRRYLMRDDDDDEENANAEDNDVDELDTSDCSLDESDFSSSVRKSNYIRLHRIK